MVAFELHGVLITFNPKANKGDFFFTVASGHGFYPNAKQYTDVWGRPYKKNCKEIAQFYVDSLEGRIKTLKTYADSEPKT
jgi:hypothetical protein